MLPDLFHPSWVPSGSSDCLHVDVVLQHVISRGTHTCGGTAHYLHRAQHTLDAVATNKKHINLAQTLLEHPDHQKSHCIQTYQRQPTTQGTSYPPTQLSRSTEPKAPMGGAEMTAEPPLVLLELLYALAVRQQPFTPETTQQ